MLKISQKIILLLIISQYAAAYPTKRPLPEGIVDEHPQYQLFRDHLESRRFYYIPKVYNVTENNLTAFGNHETNCESVAEYEETLKLLMKARLEHIKATVARLKQLNALLGDLDKMRAEQLKLLEKKRSIQGELAENEKPEGEEKNKQEALKKELESVDKLLKQFGDKIAQAETLRTGAEAEQTAGLAQIEKLEKSLTGFEARLTKGAGRVTLRLKLPQETTTEALRKEFNLQKGDILVPANYLGLSLFPALEDDLDFRERTAKAATTGAFVPEWSVKSTAVPPTVFGPTETPSSLEEFPLEKELSMTSIVSLYTFCALNKTYEVDRLKQTIVPVRVQYTFALWKSPAAKSESGSLGKVTMLLNPVAWKLAEALPSATSEVGGVTMDSGDPKYFSDKGYFEPHSITTSFKLILDTKEKK